MTHEEFKKLIGSIFNEYYCGESDIIIFAKQKYDFEDEYTDFEIILSSNDLPFCHDRFEIDYDYDEGQDDYIFDGWWYLDDLLDYAHRRGVYE